MLQAQGLRSAKVIGKTLGDPNAGRSYILYYHMLHIKYYGIYLYIIPIMYYIYCDCYILIIYHRRGSGDALALGMLPSESGTFSLSMRCPSYLESLMHFCFGVCSSFLARDSSMLPTRWDYL